jgi:hypothetical protein
MAPRLFAWRVVLQNKPRFKRGLLSAAHPNHSHQEVPPIVAVFLDTGTHDLPVIATPEIGIITPRRASAALLPRFVTLPQTS